MNVPIVLLVAFILLIVLIIGIMVWQKNSAENYISIRRNVGNPKKSENQKQRFTKDDKQALLLIREIANIIDIVDKMT